YGAMSAFAIDPIYIDVDQVPDSDTEHARKALGEDGLNALMRVRKEPRADYTVVRVIKRRVLAASAKALRTAGGELSKHFDAWVQRASSCLRDPAPYPAL